jgi:Ulp1 family protease
MEEALIYACCRRRLVSQKTSLSKLNRIITAKEHHHCQRTNFKEQPSPQANKYWETENNSEDMSEQPNQKICPGLY